MLNKETTSGFTVVELIVVMTVMGILAGIVFGALSDLYYSNVKSIAITSQISDTRGALHSIEDDLTLSNAVVASYAPLTSPLGSNDQMAPWSYSYPGVGSPMQTLIIESAASTQTTPDRRDFIINGNTAVSPQGCTPSSNSVLLYNTIVFFVKNSTLYRRTINNPNPCGQTIIQKQSCAAAYSSNSNCRAVDARLVDNVSALTFKYYAQASDTAPMAIDPTNAGTLIPTAKAVDVTIETTRRIDGKSNTMAASTRVIVSNRQ
ncbi:type II secretion system protein [Candidatus Saccharibacteria bacterium]|nr:type II secretion system protein [Candidatus Saccharibacteria bacterium]